MDDLKNIVAHALEKKGVMAKIRAELRAHVFQAIEEQEGSTGLRSSSSGELSSQARRLASISSSPHSALLLELVKEFLDFYELDYTSSTMNAEAKLGGTGSSSPTAHKDRTALATAARLQSGPSEERPLLLDLLLQAQGLSTTTSNIVPAAAAHSSGIPRTGGLPTHSPSPSYELQHQREQPQSHAASQPDSFDLDSSQSHSRSSGPSRRSGDGDHASKYSISPPAATASSGAPVSPSTPTGASANPMSISLTSASSATQPAPVSPTTDANGNATGPSGGRRRRDRNLDMAAVRQEVHTTTATATAPAANSTTAAPASHSSTKLSALPSLAMNKSAPLPPVDVPLIELDPSSDLDASGELQQSHSRHPHQSRNQHAASSSFDGEDSLDASGHGGAGGGLATSVELDQQRVAEIDRLLKSYQAQGVAPGPGQGLAGTNISSSTSSAQPSASQSRAGSAAQSRDNYDGINTSGAAPKSRAGAAAHQSTSSAAADEDEYGDEEFAASDVGARSAEGDAIEESLEVDVDGPEEDSAALSPLKARGAHDAGRPTTAGSMQQDDSLDAEYFNSNSSLVEQSHGGAGARKSSVAPLGRRAQIPPSIHSASHSSVDHEGSQSELDASASYDDHYQQQRGGGGASKAPPAAAAPAERDPLDVYSEDQSVNDPLEEQFDYTEEVEPVA